MLRLLMREQFDEGIVQRVMLRFIAAYCYTFGLIL